MGRRGQHRVLDRSGGRADRLVLYPASSVQYVPDPLAAAPACVPGANQLAGSAGAEVWGRDRWGSVGSLDAGVGAVEVALEIHGEDLEAGRGEHRLDQPAEGAELGADVYGVVLAGVAVSGVGRG